MKERMIMQHWSCSTKQPWVLSDAAIADLVVQINERVAKDGVPLVWQFSEQQVGQVVSAELADCDAMVVVDVDVDGLPDYHGSLRLGPQFWAADADEIPGEKWLVFREAKLISMSIFQEA